MNSRLDVGSAPAEKVYLEETVYLPGPFPRYITPEEVDKIALIGDTLLESSERRWLAVNGLKNAEFVIYFNLCEAPDATSTDPHRGSV